jgi:hypothetical protein
MLRRVGTFVLDQFVGTALAGVQLVNGGQQARGILRAAQQVHGFLPSGELFFGQDHDVAFSALARDEEGLPIVRHAIEPGRHVLA